MTRSEFFEWLETCPTHKYDLLDESHNHCRILFSIDEDPEEGET
mgnify:CR=1 FL=1